MYSVREVSIMIGKSEWSTYELIREQKIAYVKLGKLIRITEISVENYLKEIRGNR